jgi:hypothetical protein
MRRQWTRFVVGLLFFPGVWQSNGPTKIADLSAVDAPISYAGQLVDNVVIKSAAGQNIVPDRAPTQNLGTFSLVIVPGSTLAGNAAALAAFNRAANAWASRISDPITVTTRQTNRAMRLWRRSLR